jgi:hypothetical protein
MRAVMMVVLLGLAWGLCGGCEKHVKEARDDRAGERSRAA